MFLHNPAGTSQVVNAGVSGNTTTDLLQRLDADVLQQNPDLVILMIGTNDMLNSKKMISYKSYQNNLSEIADKIRRSGSEILLVSPPTVDSIYLFRRHDKGLFEDAPNAKLDMVRTIMKDLCIKKNMKFLDLYQSFLTMNLPRHNDDLFIRNERNSGAADGVHPTRLGYRFIAESVLFFLMENKWLEKYKKIICFGDSITYGSGTGNPASESYPAVLEGLIEIHKQ